MTTFWQRLSDGTSSGQLTDRHPSNYVFYQETNAHKIHRQELAQRGISTRPETLGVCFSGGGVRSANLCLGLYWRLAEKDLLREVTYLSAVSGGAYASAGLATDLVAEWKRNPPSGDNVNEWYREVLWRTICRFQQNANHLLYSLQCIKRLGGVYVQRAAGLLAIFGLWMFMAVVHPLTFVLFLDPTFRVSDDHVSCW